MQYTNKQLEAIDNFEMSNLFLRKMWESERQLGYCSRGKRSYDINIAGDVNPDEVRICIFLHELGHIYFDHMDVNIKEELKAVKKLAEENGYDYKSTMMVYNGPMSFLNVAMDLEVNTKLLTPDNIITIESNVGVELVTRERFEVDYVDRSSTFRDYYIPLFERAKSDSQNISKAIKDLIKDLLDSGMGEGNGSLEGDQEIEDLLKEEGYVGGDKKAQKKNVDRETTVGDFEESGDKEAGTSSTTTNSLMIEGNGAEDIKKFFLSILDVKRDLLYKQDSIKLYNRGSRRNSDGILYSSSRRKVDNLRSSKKLGVVVDVSGSMETSDILEALTSIKDIFSLIHRDSELVTCTTRVVEKFPINKLPKSVNVGGGTDMSKGLEYFIKKGFTDIVIYSDFETDIQDMINLLNSRVRVYSIMVPYSNYDEEWISKNKKILKLRSVK